MKGKGTFLAIEDILECVRAYLLAQQCRSEDADNEPRYRRFDNHRCGVDVLIDGAFYCSAIERPGVSLPRVPGEDPLACTLCCSDVNVDDDQVVDLLIDLQGIHDPAIIESQPTALEDIG